MKRLLLQSRRVITSTQLSTQGHSSRRTTGYYVTARFFCSTDVSSDPAFIKMNAEQRSQKSNVVRELLSRPESNKKMLDEMTENTVTDTVEFNPDSYSLKAEDEVAIQQLRERLQTPSDDSATLATEKILEDYSMLLKSIREKRRLTLDWTSNTDDSMSAVRRAAERVGFKIE